MPSIFVSKKMLTQMHHKTQMSITIEPLQCSIYTCDFNTTKKDTLNKMPETNNACVNASLDPNVFYYKTFLMQLLQHNKGIVSLFN